MVTSPRSPLKAKPLRTPGQSVSDEIQKVLDDKVLPTLLVVAALWMIALIEWFGVLANAPRMPWIYTVIATAATAYAVWLFRKAKRRVVQLKQARDGELVVGQFLDGLREDGARIFHDIPGEGFNLDHVVVSLKGIFVIETKTLSKPYPDSKITIKDASVLVSGFPMDRDPIKQVRSQVTWLSRVLEETTGKKFPIKGSVVFPGWFVDPPPAGSNLEIWVLSARALPSFIENEPTRLKADDLSLASYHLSRFIRAAQAELE